MAKMFYLYDTIWYNEMTEEELPVKGFIAADSMIEALEILNEKYGGVWDIRISEMFESDGGYVEISGDIYKQLKDHGADAFYTNVLVPINSLN